MGGQGKRLKDERRARRRSEIESLLRRWRTSALIHALYLLQGKFRSIMIGPTDNSGFGGGGDGFAENALWWLVGGPNVSSLQGLGFKPPTLL